MCNKKVAGIALVVTGVILVVVGIIVGVLLPNIAKKTIEDQTCVNSKDSPGYKRWEGPTDFTTKVYIWNITNKDGFLSRREKPKLEEKGPYVYSTKSKKVNVKFENGKVASTSFDQVKFNKTLTEKECLTCTEQDKLTVLNAAYLGLMQKTGSATFFGTASIPLILGILFHALNQTTGNRNKSLIMMGQDQNKLEHQHAPSNPAFGAWVASENPSLKRNFSLEEMSGLYGVLTEVTKFVPFTNASLLEQCRVLNASSNASKDCGIVHNFLVLERNQVQAVKVIHELLCPHPSSCFNITRHPTYIPLVGKFISDALPKYVLGYLESNNYGLTSTLNQRDIILGYVMNNLPLPPEYPTGVTVPGSVTSHLNEETAKQQGTNSTFFTCESTEGDRFSYAAVGGETKTNRALYPTASEEQLKVRGYFVQFPGQKSLKPCKTKYNKLASSYELYMTKFRFAVPFEYKEDVVVHNIPLHKYVLGDNAVKVNNVTVFTRGVFNVTGIFQGPIYISLPGFLYGEPTLYNDFNLPKPDVKKYESFLSIEPISGTAMDFKLRIQLNGIILPAFVSSDHQTSFNVSYVNKLIPIWWSETSAIIDAGSAKEFSSKLFGSLRLSCGLLVALPVIGGIILIVGVVLIVLSVKRGTSVTTA